MSEATLLEKLVKMGLPLDAAYTEGQFQYVIDAALRRAKAEVWREAAKLGNEQSPHHTVCALKWARECDARAAQIEEGE